MYKKIRRAVDVVDGASATCLIIGLVLGVGDTSFIVDEERKHELIKNRPPGSRHRVQKATWCRRLTFVLTCGWVTMKPLLHPMR